MSEGEVPTAVVIGASMAGLLTARILSEHFDRVVLLERDRFPTPGENRKGVPQGKHTHVLLERGRRTMEHFLPGLSEELASLGAALIDDVSLQVRWFRDGAYHRPGVSGLGGVGVSRPTLEAAVRRRVLELPKVEAREQIRIVGLRCADDRVTGVEAQELATGRTETVDAQLVVDASGRGSRTPGWLEDMGFPAPPEEQVRIDMGYATCFFHRRPDQLPGLEGIVLFTTPPDRRLAVILAQDHNRWVVTIGGYLGHHAPTDPEGFLEAARALPAHEIFEAIRDAEACGPPVHYRFPANLRRRYENLSRFPEGLLVIGDGLCSFNPIYGQGMTVAALEAEALGACLAEGSTDLAGRFFAAAGGIIDSSWNAAVGNDLGFEEIEGPRTPPVRFFNWYLRRLHRAAHTDSRVSIAFLELINMVAPPWNILRPQILWRVTRASVAAGARRYTPRESPPR